MVGKSTRFGEELFEQFGIDKDLVTRFFAVFARFEYALKQSGYFDDTQKHVKPDWSAFASDMDDLFATEKNEDAELQEAVGYLLKHPPKKQVVEGAGGRKKLGWLVDTPASACNPLDELLKLVKDTRNNLFHGGKFRQGPAEDPARDSNLLSYCLIVLRECLNLCAGNEKCKAHQVQSYFFERR